MGWSIILPQQMILIHQMCLHSYHQLEWYQDRLGWLSMSRIDTVHGDNSYATFFLLQQNILAIGNYTCMFLHRCYPILLYQVIISMPSLSYCTSNICLLKLHHQHPDVFQHFETQLCIIANAKW
jgi:hypothetical protein